MFSALDLVVFYIFFEAVLIPMFLLVFGGIDRIYATFKFFLYTLFGSVLMLVGIIYIIGTVGSSDIYKILNYTFSENEQFLVIYSFLFFICCKGTLCAFSYLVT